MREELESTQRDLEASRAIRSELATELANATTDRKLAEERLETERVRADGLIKQIEEKEQAMPTGGGYAIATLQTQLEELQSEKLEKLEEQTPAGKVEPETITNQAAPSMNPEPETVTSEEPINQESANGDWVEVGRGELMAYIYKRFPGAEAEIKAQNITDAINGKSKRMPEFEEKYRFKHIGKKAGQHRFKIPNNY